MKKAIIISCFDNYSYDVRIKYIERYFCESGYECTVVAANFDHRNKRPYTNNRKNLVLLDVPKYKKNISFSRIYSHRIFAKLARKYVEQEKADIVYVSTPPNFLVKYFAKYKLKNKSTKLIFEVGDMWPETLPLKDNIKQIISPLTNIWAKLRNKYIKYADGIIFECDLFKNHLLTYIDDTKNATIYLCKDNTLNDLIITEQEKLGEVLHFLYLGSINNIIDYELIVNLLVLVNREKKCELDVIGDGENKDRLIELCKENNITVNVYGIVYDEIRKYEIASKAHFAFNVMKSIVFVGATMKSLDYLCYGIPLINTISGDTEELVLGKNCGINVNRNDLSETATKLINLDTTDWKMMKRNARQVYLDYFETSIMQQQFHHFCNEVLDDIM